MVFGTVFRKNKQYNGVYVGVGKVGVGSQGMVSGSGQWSVLKWIGLALWDLILKMEMYDIVQANRIDWEA